ncbi:MAG: DUF3574 domain-containing protein [Chloroflexi bacterium]|nr:DUF3574 domain-containing protein [Chloroflexota bacterium]
MGTFVSLGLTALLAAACGGGDTSACPEGTELFAQYDLYMGRSDASGEIVDDAVWTAFLDETVTPRFPDGLTVLDAQGRWRGPDGQVQRERSRVLVVLAPPGGDAARLLDEVSEEYKRRFAQESVLRVVQNACVSF